MPSKRRTHAEGRSSRLKDPVHAAAYLNAALAGAKEYKNHTLFLKALRNVAEATQISKVAEQTGLNRESLYRMLSETGNPTWLSLWTILEVLGLELSFAPSASPKDQPMAEAELSSFTEEKTPITHPYTIDRQKALHALFENEKRDTPKLKKQTMELSMGDREFAYSV